MVRRSRRGRLKLYVGYAAGVGKTYRMLEETRALRARGVDCVIAFVETHGRRETEALLADLPVVPRRRVEYRGVAIEEMDVDAVLARRPEVVVVDEIPHTNAPDSRNQKRWQDVEELLDAGVHVIGALNVQHLESLNDGVRRATGVSVRETVPDRFVVQADQVVNVDLSIEDLDERLRAGKIYALEKIPAALESFFRPENLSALREIALREVAESVLRASRQERSPGLEPAEERVMVCITSRSPHTALLLRRAARIAGRLGATWYAVHVETPAEAPDRIDAEAQRMLLASLETARQLGADVVRLHGEDPVQALVDFAVAHRVGHVILGRSLRPLWTRWTRRDAVSRLLDAGTKFDVQVVALDRPGDAPPPAESRA